MTDQQQENFDQNSEDELLESVDFDKVRSILLKSLPWILLIFFIFNTGAFLYVRYTKPIYESSSVLKLDIQSEASLIGVSNPLENQNISGLSGEIELLKSNLFFGKVIDVVGLDVSYHFYGRYLTDERYKNSPFAVSYKLHNGAFYDTPIDLEILNASEYILKYEIGGTSYKKSHRFGEEIKTNDFNFLIETTEYFGPGNSTGEYYFTINSRASLLNYFKRNVTVQPLNVNAKTITVSLQDFNKFKARALVQAIDTLYLSYTKEAKNQALEQKIAFVDSQLRLTEAKLESFEYYFENFTIDNRTVNLQQDLVKVISVLERLDSTQFHLENRLQAIRLINRQIADGKPLSISPFSYRFFPEFITEALQQFRELQTERDKLLASYNDNTFVVQRKNTELKILSEDLLELIRGYTTNLEETKLSIETQRKALEKNFESLPSMGTEYNKQRRFYNMQEAFFMSLMQGKADLEIARAGTVTNFVIFSPADLPNDPVHPVKGIIYGIGFAVSFILSLIFLGLRYVLSNEISGLAELERLISLPVLGTVPVYKHEKKNGKSQLVVHKIVKSAISEALRTVRTNMEFMHIGDENKVISITSTISGEGKTFVSVNLAGIIALSNLKVVILDLDLRKAKVHLAFGHDKSDKGMSTILLNRHSVDECIRKTDIPTLDYIPVGPIPPNPSELLMGGDYDRILAELRKKYDFIIMDTPPIGLVTDGILVMKKADLPIYIVRAEYSKRTFVKTIKKVMQMNKFKHMALILNGTKKSSSYGYGYGYGYGYYDDKPQKKWYDFLSNRNSKQG